MRSIEKLRELLKIEPKESKKIIEELQRLESELKTLSNTHKSLLREQEQEKLLREQSTELSNSLQIENEQLMNTIKKLMSENEQLMMLNQTLNNENQSYLNQIQSYKEENQEVLEREKRKDKLLSEMKSFLMNLTAK